MAVHHDSSVTAPSTRKQNAIDATADILAGGDCERFVDVMRLVYRSDFPAACQRGEDLVRTAQRIGLLSVDGRSLTLSPAGYLVGNVAKEYGNYLDNGHRAVGFQPPTEFYEGKDVLDLGCAFGRWLWQFQRHARSATGIELQAEYIQLGRVLARREGIPRPHIIQDSIEELDRHIPPESMDLVFARLVFNHVAIRPTLKKAIAVLRPGGFLWIHVAPFKAAVAEFRRSVGVRNRTLTAFQVFNSLLCTITGRQLTIQARGRMHSHHKQACPTGEWWQHVFAREGLKDFTFATYSHIDMAFFARK